MKAISSGSTLINEPKRLIGFVVGVCAENRFDRFRLLRPHLEEKRSLKAVARDAGIRYRMLSAG
jgi:hypothetical protein